MVLGFEHYRKEVPMRSLFLGILILFPLLSAEGSSRQWAGLDTTWQFVDSVSFRVRIPAGDRCYIWFDNSAESLGVWKPPDGLIERARQAVGRAPDWLKVELADNFSRLDSIYQETCANIILGGSDPYVDELSFSVAHLAPQTLTNPSFYPDLLTENAEWLYWIDDSLDYVEILDYGSSADSTYYSTTRYWVAEGVDTFQLELPKEYYYWFIVHPKLHKELPTYINPETGNPAPPPTGWFWRNYLFNHADSGYIPLRDWVSGCLTLWNGIQNSPDNGALGVVTQWIQDVMTFITTPHHDQPVRIYHLHRGTCSVHSYLTSGAARTVLIPTTVTAAYRYNHKWNEFWERRWIQWEPVNTWIDYYPYDHWGGGDNIPGCFDWRGDGYIWTMVERYTPVCTLTVDVEDANSNPVDGARIAIDSPGFPGPRVTAGWTDCAGRFQVLLGDSVSYFTAQVSSSVGTYPTTTVITNSEAGEHYTWLCNLSGTIPQLQASPDSVENPLDWYKLEFRFNLPQELIYGVNPDDGGCFSQTFSPGKLNFFICDQGNFSSYAAGDPFQAFQISEDVTSKDTILITPTDDQWYLVFSNEDRVVATEVLDLNVNLYKNLTPGISELAGHKSQVTSHELGQNFPNPFSHSTQIAYSVWHMAEGNEAISHKPLAISLKVYDLTGRLVRTLVDEEVEPGFHMALWDGQDSSGRRVSSGIYFYRLTAGDFTAVRSMMMLK